MASRSCLSAAFLAGRALSAAARRSPRILDALESSSAPLFSLTTPSSFHGSRPFSSVPNQNFFEVYNRQRQLLPLNHLIPDVAVDAWVAPNAVLVGGVTVEDKATVWYGAVLRADLNYITIGTGSSIGDKVVISSVAPSDDGLSTETRVGRQSAVGAQSVLRSCEIEEEVVIGQKCLVLEGAVVEKHAVLADGSVVGPGCLIPGGQLWAGNPAKFVRNISEDEKVELPKVAEASRISAADHAEEFLPVSSTYIQVEKLEEFLGKVVKEKEKEKAKAVAK